MRLFVCFLSIFVKHYRPISRVLDTLLMHAECSLSIICRKYESLLWETSIISILREPYCIAHICGVLLLLHNVSIAAYKQSNSLIMVCAFCVLGECVIASCVLTHITCPLIGMDIISFHEAYLSQMGLRLMCIDLVYQIIAQGFSWS